MIGCQGIPIDAVIKVRDGQGLLIGGYRRTASVCPSVWGAQAKSGQEAASRTFCTSAGGCANSSRTSSDSMLYTTVSEICRE